MLDKMNLQECSARFDWVDFDMSAPLNFITDAPNSRIWSELPFLQVSVRNFQTISYNSTGEPFLQAKLEAQVASPARVRVSIGWAANEGKGGVGEEMYGKESLKNRMGGICRDVGDDIEC